MCLGVPKVWCLKDWSVTPRPVAAHAQTIPQKLLVNLSWNLSDRIFLWFPDFVSKSAKLTVSYSLPVTRLKFSITIYRWRGRKRVTWMFTPTMVLGGSLHTSKQRPNTFPKLHLTWLVHMAPILNPPGSLCDAHLWIKLFFPVYLVPVEFTGLAVCWSIHAR